MYTPWNGTQYKKATLSDKESAEEKKQINWRIQRTQGVLENHHTDHKMD